jgi:glycosyltransferase involved in cell wall biosynthesis
LKILVAIPALNEAETIVDVVTAVRRISNHDVLVVDDGSIDRTANLAIQAGASVITHPFNMGVGAAMRTAFSYALKMEYEIVVQVDADGQHPPQEIQKIIDVLNFSDVAIGSRLIEKTNYEFSKVRRIAILTLSGLLKLLTGKEIFDPTSGFRAANKRAIAIFADHYPSEYLGDTVASILIASKYGLTINETKVEMKMRQGGLPSQNLLKSTFLMFRVMFFLIITQYRKVEYY